MKKFLLVISLAFSASTFANSIEATGKVFYKMPSEEIVFRDVSLILPERGEGDVILKGEIELVADAFFTSKRDGKTIFYVVFSDFPGSQEGELSVFKGTYIRGTNLAMYYGEVFIMNDCPHEELNPLRIEDAIHHEKRYVAGFYFKKEIAKL